MQLLGKAVLTFLISMVPIVELRGGIPFGVAHGLPIGVAFLIAIVGNLIPAPFIILFIKRIFKWLRTKSAWLERVVSKMEEKAEKKKGQVIRYQFWGLMVLVAIPLPGTGAWTGALVAAMLDMEVKRAMPAIIIGVIVAGVLISLATAGVIAMI